MLNNDTTINGVLSLKNGFWHKSMDIIERLYFSASGTSFFHSGLSAGNGSGFVFRSYAHSDILTIDYSGSISCTGAITTGNFNSFLGGLRINGSDTANTIWQNTGNLSISANTGNNIDFSIGNGTERMKINNNGEVSINGKQGTTNIALIVTDATNATLKIGFPSSGNIGIGGNQGHHLNFGYFSTNADTVYTSQMILNTSTGNVGIGTNIPREN
jgi:hypothetical protein